MPWKKLGKIFDPTGQKLIAGCLEFAQAPQALVFDDFVRIYFSTRKKEANGKFLSHISFVDFNKDFKKIRKVSSETVIPLGALGTFDEHGIFPISPVRDGDKILAYTGGWSRRIAVLVETSIGLAISDDNGLTFKKLGDGPVLSSSLKEPFLVGDGFVRKFAGTYHMWYIYGERWINTLEKGQETPERVYKIAQAISKDGLTWEKEGRKIISDKLNADECQALPTVIFYKGRYQMYFCYRQATDFRKNKERGYRIGYAYSDNLVDWVRADAKVGIELSEEGWDSEMMCYPNVFKCDDKIYLLYNGNEFGRGGFGLAVWEETNENN